MTDFHLETVHELRNSLEVWRARLEEAESDLKYRMTQAAKARGIAEGAQQRVTDYERLLAVVETAQAEPGPVDEPLVMDAEEYHASIWTDAIATASTAQLEGVACINCARVFDDEPNYAAATGPRGQLFAHSYPDDCKGATS